MAGVAILLNKFNSVFFWGLKATSGASQYFVFGTVIDTTLVFTKCTFCIAFIIEGKMLSIGKRIK